MQQFQSPAQADIFKNYFKESPTKSASSYVGSNIGNNPQALVEVDSSSHGLRANGNVDIEGFTDKLKTLLDEAWEDNWGDFSMEEPTGNDVESVALPVITFDVVHRKASTGKTGVKARPTEIILDPENPDYTLILHRQWFDCVTEYLIFHKTNRDARRLADRFELFMDSYRGFFREQGVSEMIFQEEVDARLSKKYKEGIPSNCLRFFMVIERILVERVKTTKELRSKIQASTSGRTTDPGLEFVSR